MAVALLLAGLALLVGGGQVLVRGAERLARAIGLSPLVVGLTVVSFATSAPELAVTVDASLSGSPGLAVGNVVGSNMANVLLVLGVAGLILPLSVRSPVVRRDVPVMIGLSVVLLVMSLAGNVSRGAGAVLFALLVAYVAWTVVRTRPSRVEVDDHTAPAGAAVEEQAVDEQAVDEQAVEEEAVGDELSPGRARVPVDIVFVAAGVALLVVGAEVLVEGATDVARELGMSDLVIGLTIVAVGTSLPELAASVVAALRGEIEMAVGNAVGSNIFNIGSVMGLTAIVSSGGVPVDPGAVRFDIPVMIAVALALLPVAFTGAVVSRWEAGLFVLYYAAYATYLLLDSAGHDALPAFNAVMLLFALPITALTLVVLVAYEVGLRRGRREVEAAGGATEAERPPIRPTGGR